MDNNTEPIQKDHGLSISYQIKFPPLTDSQLELCRKLDRVYEESGLKAKPSDMFKGAVCAADQRLKSNPDWISQAANSLREILYPFYSRNTKEVSRDEITTKSVVHGKDFIHEVGSMYYHLSNLTHHGTSGKREMTPEDIKKIDFETLLSDFEGLISEALKRQIDVFTEIDSLIAIPIEMLDEIQISSIINLNRASQEYFFAHVPISWVKWLNQNEFFVCLNHEAEDKSSYRYSLYEITFLDRVVDEMGEIAEVVKIIQAVDCAVNFNPEVVQRFLILCKKLPANYLSIVVEKIKRENWVSLIKDFNPSGYTFKGLIETLRIANDQHSLLTLAKVILATNPDKEAQFSKKNFYVDFIYESDVFKVFEDLDDEHTEEGIKLLTDVLSQLTIKKMEFEHNVYEYDDNYYFRDFDFYDLKDQGYSPDRFTDPSKSILRSLGILIERIFKRECHPELKRIYEKHIEPLPDSQTLWRIKLFTMSFCPNLFDKKLKTEFNRIFEVKRYSQLLFGTEYMKSLKIVFPTWSEDDQREFVQKLLKLFTKLLNEHNDESWHNEQGWEIFSMISPHLDDETKENTEVLFAKKLDSNFSPVAKEDKIYSSFITDKSPVNFEDFNNVEEILNALKKDLRAEVLREKYINDPFRAPRNIEGVGRELCEDFKRRPSDYINHTKNFISKEIHVHYLHSFLRGAEEYLREKNAFTTDDWKTLIAFFDSILVNRPMDLNKSEGRMLADWNWIEHDIADVLKFFFIKENESVFTELRELCLKIIKVLLQSDDPTPEHENDGKGELHSIAINSTRGRAFEDLVSFVFLDGKELKEDVLNLYKEIIVSATPSLRFLIGRYISSFYFRSKENISELLESIFPRERIPTDASLAAWEGYLTSSLHEELFDVISPYYEYALKLNPELYPQREGFSDIDEAVGVHLALAFSHFKDVRYDENIKHHLLEVLFIKGNLKQQQGFISFLGRGVISHGKAKDDWFKEKNVDLTDFKKLWELLLEEDLETAVYQSFGFWVNDKIDVFDYIWLADMVAKTLEKTGGIINWDRGIEIRLQKFADVNPEATIIILKNLLIGGLIGSQRMNWYQVKDTQIEVFKTIYKENPGATKDLINELLEKGGRTFWPLRKIVV